MRSLGTVSILVCLFCLTPLIFRGQSKPDSLKAILANEQNAQKRAQLMNELAFEIKARDLNTSVAYAMEAREIAMANGFKHEQGISQSILGLLISYTDFYDSAIAWNKSAIPLLENSGDSTEISRNYNRLGTNYLLKSDYKNAAPYLLLAVNWANAPKLKSGPLNNLGMLAKKSGDYDKAVFYYLNSLKQYDLMNEPLARTRTLNNLGSLYIQKKDYKKAREVFQEALTTSEELQEPEVLGPAMAGMGLTEAHLGTNTQAILYTSKACEILKNAGLINDYAKQMITLGDLQNDNGHYKLAEKSYQEAESVLLKNDDKFGLSALYNNMADCYMKQKKLKSAVKYLEKSYALSKQYQDLNYNRLIVKNLANTYEQIGEVEKALKYRKMYEELNDKMVNVAENVKYVELTHAYETQKKEKKLEIQGEKINELESSRKYYFMGLGILLVISALVIWLYRKRIRHQQLLEENILSIEKQIDSLKDENEQLKVKLLATEAELEGLAVKYIDVKEKLPEHLIALSKREYEVLLFMAEGLTDKEIAEKIFVSINTVRTHVRRIYDKLFIKSRVEAVAYLNRYHLLAEAS